MRESPRVVLDTGALWRPEALRSLLADDRPTVLPAVAFAERVRQVAFQGLSGRDLFILLHDYDIEVEAFNADHAMQIGRMDDDAAWKRQARDAMIARHVRLGDELWTTNPKDFVEVGLAEEQIVAV